MFNKGAFLGLILIAVATARMADGATVHLICKSEENPQRDPLELTLNESDGTVSFAVASSGATNIYKADFGSDKVTWSDRMDFGILVRSVDRSTLRLTEDLYFSGEHHYTYDKCSLIRKKNNIF